MKKLILILLLFGSMSVFAQDPYLQKSNPDAREAAVKITNEYNKDLALSGEQQVLFQQKVEEFLIKRNKIEKEYSGKEKLDMLVLMQRDETSEMHNILTQMQMDYYIKAKPSLQPVETISAKALEKK